MAKPFLREPYQSLYFALVETMTAGLKEWRSDLEYPESHSDWRSCIDAVMRKYDVKLRPIPLDRLEIWERNDMCPVCRKEIGEGVHVTTLQRFDDSRQTYAHYTCVTPPDKR